MSTTIGNRIFRCIHRPDPQLMAAFRDLPASNINDEMGRLYCMNSSIVPLNRVTSMFGTALTVKAPAGDNLMFHQALDMAQPGDIIVVDGGGDLNRALAGEINVPVVCGGQVVLPGDILVGDADGIVVIRQQDAPEVLAAAVKKKTSEDKTFETMNQSVEAYAQKHLNSTAKRMADKNITVFDNTYWDTYHL